MIADLGELARTSGAADAFDRRLDGLRQRHNAKSAFIRRLREMARSD